ncbi:hypothetical protein CPB83DRAFT_849041 [Crepidotus variabilis]|uniref:SAP domain-containing protein n=1 Tax=Crepidotus variabilis TaxID=179855 RepID=A0A9P6JSL0_9AGAR|nr:hypothetical protein CPB83DRAFT_849041 [Crepidotus variabilis]
MHSTATNCSMPPPEHDLMDVDPPAAVAASVQEIALSTATQDSGALPFPARDPKDSCLTVCYLQVIGASNKQLKEWCRSYGLSVSGKKSDLVARLKEFSSDKEKWKRFEPTKRRMHRNPHTDGQTKSSSVKKSTRRADAIFPERDIQPSAHLPHLLPEGPAPWVLAKEKALLQWAEETSAELPYVSKENREKAAEIYLQKSRAAMNGGVEYPPQVLKQTNDRLDQLSALIIQQNTNARVNINPALSTSSISSCMSWEISPPTLQTVTNNEAIAPTRTIHLDGRQLIFTEADVGRPPAHSFAADPPFTLEAQLRKLNAMWDSDPAHWRGLDTGLKICGADIPLAYLRDVYATRRGAKSQTGHVWKQGQWKGIKNSWFNWRDIVSYWRQGSEAQFWYIFSTPSGKRLAYSKILDKITELRNTQDITTAGKARAEYISDFDVTFGYRKGSEKKVMTQDRAIARRYRSLCNQPAQGDDDDDWL